jgi:hypothetical protein
MFVPLITIKTKKNTMALFNITMARALPTDSLPTSFVASQDLMNVLLRNRFAEMSEPGNDGLRKIAGRYNKGQVYYFRKHGQCTINFLKDGRIHVLYGPVALWNLHDTLTTDELNVLIAFATLSEEQQEVMRNYMAPRCSQSAVDRRYTDVLRNMPLFNVDWKKDFLEAFGRVL